jgi:hypothetical protein
VIRRGAGLPGISAVVMMMSTSFARAVLVFLEVEHQELGVHALDLLLHLGARVEGADDGAHALGRADRGETRDARADHEDLGRRDLAGGGDLAGKEAAEVLRGLDDGAVAGDVGHRAQRVHLLRARDTRHAVHRQGGDAAPGQRLEKVGILRRPDEADQRLPGP